MAVKDGSVTHWIRDLQAGDEGTVQTELWDRYFRRLVALARSKLRDSPARAMDEEDVALAALQSFFHGVKNDRFPELRDRNNLWPLLAKITARKAFHQRRHQRAAKRGMGRLRGESALESPGMNDEARGLEQYIGTEPTPEFAQLMVDQCGKLMNVLNDATLRSIASQKLHGYSNAEIAATLNRSERTVERKLELIRAIWGREFAETRPTAD